MNTAKAQQEILKQLIDDPSRVGYFEAAEEDKIFITANGKVGYLIPLEDLRLSLTGAQCMVHVWDDFEAALGTMSNLLQETDEYRLGGKARKYLRSDDPGAEIYVNSDLLKVFNHPQLWQKFGSFTNPIVVTESFCSDGAPVPVGIVCPVKVDN